MTTKQLERLVTIGPLVSYGHREIEICYRGKYYKCITNNKLAIDAIKSESVVSTFYYTKRKAIKALYDECKEKNNLK